MMVLKRFVLVVGIFLLIGACAGAEDPQPDVVVENGSETEHEEAREKVTFSISDMQQSDEAVSSSEPLRILPLGDSITAGEPAHYRYELDRYLRQAGTEFDFVGSMRGDAAYYEGQWDVDHEGHSGWTTADIAAELPSWLEGYTADVALIHLGTNDIFEMLESGDDAQMIASQEKMREIVETLQSDNREIDIFIAQILPVYVDDPDVEATLNGAILEWNGALLSLASELETTQSSVNVVDMNRGMTAELFADGVHPSDAGAAEMARRWAVAILGENMGRSADSADSAESVTTEPRDDGDGSVALIRPDVHDPAQLVRYQDKLMLFASAVEWQEYDLATGEWAFLGDDLYGGDALDWDDGDGQFWAPAVLKLEQNRFLIYHSAVFDEENHGSKIGFVLGGNRGSSFDFRAADRAVVMSDGVDQPFAIDPAVFFDDDGRLWLVYGSHGAGIFIAELDAETGYLLEEPDAILGSPDDERFTHIANYGGDLYDENNVEAAYIYNHPDSEFYYLFVNWDRCCNGLESTYQIRVGRSTSPTGPFLDQDGRDLADGGGTLFLDAAGDILGDTRFVGPGHAGVYRHSDGADYFSHHFYDRTADGLPSWALWRLEWADGWPEIDTEHVVDLRP